MDTWALQAAAYAALTSGYRRSGFPLGGSASLDGFALGVMAASVVFLTLNSSWKFRSSWWQADGWQHPVRWVRTAVPRRATATTSAETPAESSRPYSDVAEPADFAQLVRVLPQADEHDSPPPEPAGGERDPAGPVRRSMPAADEGFWGPRKGGGYHSKHRIPESSEPAENGEPQDPAERGELEQPRSHRRPAPRHAAS